MSEEPVRRVPRALIGGISIAALSRAETADLIIATAGRRTRRRGPPPLFTSANGEVLSRCARSTEIRRLFCDADLVSADGQPLVFASRWLSQRPLVERVATTDLFHDVAIRAARRKMSFAFYGATEGECQAAVDNVQRHYPDVRILIHSHGFLDDRQEFEFVKKVSKLKPDILWVCLGIPREQAFYYRRRQVLRGVGLIKTGGGLLNFLSGTASRAPLIWQVSGFEWLYRLLREPRRLFWRYALTNPHSLMLLITQTR